MDDGTVKGKKMRQSWILTICIAVMIVTMGFFSVQVLSSREMNETMDTIETDSFEHDMTDEGTTVVAVNFWKLLSYNTSEIVPLKKKYREFLEQVVNRMGYPVEITDEIYQYNDKEYITKYKSENYYVKVYINEELDIYSVVIDIHGEGLSERSKEYALKEVNDIYTDGEKTKKLNSKLKKLERVIKKSEIMSEDKVPLFFVDKSDTSVVDLDDSVGFIIRGTINDNGVFVYYDYYEDRICGLTVYGGE